MKNQTKKTVAHYCHKIVKTKAAIKLFGFDSNQQSQTNRLAIAIRKTFNSIRACFFFSFHVFFCIFFSPCLFFLFIFFMWLQVISLSIVFGVFFSLPHVQFRIGSFIFGMNSCKWNRVGGARYFHILTLFSPLFFVFFSRFAPHSTRNKQNKNCLALSLHLTKRIKISLFVYRVVIFRTQIPFFLYVCFAPNATLKFDWQKKTVFIIFEYDMHDWNSWVDFDVFVSLIYCGIYWNRLFENPLEICDWKFDSDFKACC